MANWTYTACEEPFSIQLRELVRINELYNNLPDLFINKIGTLFDEFNIEIPLRFEKEYGWLWKEDTVKTIKEAAETSATILNEVRLKPKPYEPLSSEDVKRQVKIIEQAITSDMVDRLLECACIGPGISYAK